MVMFSLIRFFFIVVNHTYYLGLEKVWQCSCSFTLLVVNKCACAIRALTTTKVKILKFEMTFNQYFPGRCIGE